MVPLAIVYIHIGHHGIRVDARGRKGQEICGRLPVEPPGIVSFGNQELPFLVKGIHFEPRLYRDGRGEVERAFVGQNHIIAAVKMQAVGGERYFIVHRYRGWIRG